MKFAINSISVLLILLVFNLSVISCHKDKDLLRCKDITTKCNYLDTLKHVINYDFTLTKFHGHKSTSYDLSRVSPKDRAVAKFYPSILIEKQFNHEPSISIEILKILKCIDCTSLFYSSAAIGCYFKSEGKYFILFTGDDSKNRLLLNRDIKNSRLVCEHWRYLAIN